MLSFVLMLPDLVNIELEKSLLENDFWFSEKLPSFRNKELMREPPLILDVGCANDPAVGGGPAGVVERLLQRLRERSFSGVSGGLDS